MTTPDQERPGRPGLRAGTDVEPDPGRAEGAAEERPATSDPDEMVDTPDSLGGTGANTGGAG